MSCAAKEEASGGKLGLHHPAHAPTIEDATLSLQSTLIKIAVTTRHTNLLWQCDFVARATKQPADTNVSALKGSPVKMAQMMQEQLFTKRGFLEMAHKIVNERALAEAQCPNTYAVDTEVTNAAMWLSSWQRRVVSCWKQCIAKTRNACI